MIASTVTLDERPDLIAAMWAMPHTWPAYMHEDPVSNVFFGRIAEAFPECQLVGLDEHGAVVGKVNSVPFAWVGTDDDLPERGWDAILERAFIERDRGERPTAVSLLEARVIPAHRGEGLSYRLLQAARRNVQRLGLSDLFGPVRPTAKSQEPRTPMSEYVARVRSDGLPVDPRLRVHVRMGARIVKVCPLSMIVPGSLARWREWTGLPMTDSGLLDVPEALVPVHVSVEHDHAVYVEPNVWLHHALSTT
ncbi:MAG: N-acetyltransferase [Solirubrobacteraceae bacterium]